jgi:hypothetical protein
VREPVDENVPVAGSYSSAVMHEYVSVETLQHTPPDTRTCPDGKSVAVCENLAIARGPVEAKVPLAGSYSSALDSSLLLSLLDCPPTMSTLPESSNVAV